MRRGRRLLEASVCGAALALIALRTPDARADMTKKQCATANADGQTLRLDGKLAAARVELEMCSDPHCPAIVRDDCAQRLDELERVQPSIVFDVKDSSGADVSAVTVTIDGHPAADKLGGIALKLDPGEHVFAFTMAGGAAVSRTLVIKEGEKGRRERIVLGAAPAPAGAAGAAGASEPAAPAPAATPAAEPAATTGMSRQRIIALATGGIGVVGVAVGGALGLMTFSAASQVKSDCQSATSCNNRPLAVSEHGLAATYGTASTVAFIGGGDLLAAGALLFLTSPRAPSSPTVGWTLAPAAGPGGGGVSLLGRF